MFEPYMDGSLFEFQVITRLAPTPSKGDASILEIRHPAKAPGRRGRKTTRGASPGVCIMLMLMSFAALRSASGEA